MGHKLIDVMSTDEKGLIGFTEIGEEVLLSAPRAGAIVEEFLGGGKTEIPINIERKIKGSNDKTYFYFENLITANGAYIQPYNTYIKRN